jgi:hypothetical protein
MKSAFVFKPGHAMKVHFVGRGYSLDTNWYLKQKLLRPVIHALTVIVEQIKPTKQTEFCPDRFFCLRDNNL